MTLTLAEFLLARIDEDEADARRVTWHPQAEDNLKALRNADHQRAITREPRQVFAADGRVIDADAYHAAIGPEEPITAECYAGLLDAGCNEYYGDNEYRHATRWHPARVLAECEAKRQIVELHPQDAEDRECLGCLSPTPCNTLRALALPYASHPDFRQEWKRGHQLGDPCARDCGRTGRSSNALPAPTGYPLLTPAAVRPRPARGG